MKEKLHILHIPKWYPNPEDPQLGIFVKKQIIAAAAFDKQTVLYIKSVSTLESKYIIDVKEKDGIVEVFIYYKKPESRTKQFFMLTKLYKKGFKKIYKLAGKPDLLHVHNLISPAVWSYKYARDHQIPWVLSEHWSGYTSQTGVFASKMMWERKLWQWYSEKAKCTIAVSNFLKNALIKNGIGKEHTVIPNVVESIVQENARKDEEIRILNVSDMVDSIKNISGLLDSFASLVKDFPQIRLYLVGGGKDLKKLKEKVKEMGLNKAVVFYGRLKNEEVLALYNEIDFVVINSRVETFSVVAAEALLAGKPLITTKCGGVEEFVTKDQGILIKVDDAVALKNGIKNMINDHKNYDSLSLQNYARNRFSTESVGKELHSIYHSILA
jgi:glycosyltransferase involved in cell wall biosynthesis